VQCDERELEAAAWDSRYKKKEKLKVTRLSIGVYSTQQIHSALISSGTNGELFYPVRATLAMRLVNDWATSLL
jgi:hypothetical protein